MSKTIISIERVNEVENHPNADRLDVVQVMGYKVVTGRDQFKVGDVAVYFPPDILLPEDIAEGMGVTNYLKHAIFPGEAEKRQCRVSAARLRGVPSHGFLMPLSVWCGDSRKTFTYGQDITEVFGAKKYVAPVRLGAGDAEPDLPNFHQYTSIENIQRYPDAMPEGTQVVVTEKIHGTNSRIGLIKVDDEHQQLVAGSHKVRRKYGEGLYWSFVDDEMKRKLMLLSTAYGDADVILFGEIFGPGVQDMQYGQREKAFRIFDISVNGTYLNYGNLLHVCQQMEWQMVPTLYVGPFNQSVVDDNTHGETMFDGVTGKFKGREGIVIKPLEEQHSDVLGGRMIVKSISADYLARKGATDDE